MGLNQTPEDMLTTSLTRVNTCIVYKIQSQVDSFTFVYNDIFSSDISADSPEPFIVL